MPTRRTLLGAALALPAARPALAKQSGIDETGFVTIGGLDQWIGVRGARTSNPVLLVLHGGPGEAQWPSVQHYRPWEQAFTVVQWDQRGAGRTYGRYGAQTPEMSLDRIVADGIEVAQHLRTRLGKRKIILLGHSWGSIVGVTMAQRRPDLFGAYVGTGQVASWRAVVEGQFDLLLTRARASNDTATVEMLEAIGRPDPSNVGQYFKFSRGLRAAMPPSDQAWLAAQQANTPETLGVPAKDLRDLSAGMTFSALRLLPDMVRTDLPTTAPDLAVPAYLIQGREDVTTPAAAAVAYFDGLEATQKIEAMIEDAGHFAFLTHTEQFLACLTPVRRAAIAAGA